MARAAVPGRLTGRLAWRVATVADVRTETSTARTLVLDVPGWPGHLPGQHVDVRLTAPDGYSAQRSYSIASAPNADRVELTVQRVKDGEVSPYLTDVLAVGYPLELRGPVGGWFVWRHTAPAPVLLVAGGSGIVPRMAMVRARAAVGSRVPFRLVYSVRSPADVYYGDELRRRVRDDAGLDIAFAYTRAAPDGWTGRVGRVDADTLTAHGWPPELSPSSFVCGPTGFVEAMADGLTGLGHAAQAIRTERFGPTGGTDE
jgi:ferredoxin-NADP reductase